MFTRLALIGCLVSWAQAIPASYLAACQAIAKASGSSEVAYALAPDYIQGTEHYFSSSAQIPTCVYSPTSAQELAKAVKIIASTRTPFAVESGGHASNQGFSSTKGVHISLQKINQNVLSADKKTIQVGLGQTWDTVFEALDKTGVNVVGGRVSGVGVGGYTMWGGGYSWKTNQYGLTSDTVRQFELVTYTGTVLQVTKASDLDLFFALRGGGNNFGIVTRIILETNPQTDLIYGGLRVYPLAMQQPIANANQIFSQTNKDPKAQVITTLNSVGPAPASLVLFFYDGPTPPAGTFSMFDGLTPEIDLTKQQSFVDFVKGVPAQLQAGYRGAFHTVSVLDYTSSLTAAVVNQTNYYGSVGLLKSANFISYDLEPFTNSLYNPSPSYSDAAYPHSPKRPLKPLNLYFSWVNPAEDDFWHNEMKKSAAILTAAAEKDGQDLSNTILYPNYCLADTPLQQLYGPNLARLQKLHKRYDPNNVAALTGGFRL